MTGPDHPEAAQPPQGQQDIDVLGKDDMTGLPTTYHVPFGGGGGSAPSGTDPEAVGIDIQKRKDPGSLYRKPASPGLTGPTPRIDPPEPRRG
jgi:hypothetical protein